VKEIPDDEGETIEYFSCPMLFVPPSIWDFLEQLEYRDRFPHTAIPYHERDPRWVSAERYFLGKVAEFKKLVDQG